MFACLILFVGGVFGTGDSQTVEFLLSTTQQREDIVDRYPPSTSHRRCGVGLWIVFFFCLAKILFSPTWASLQDRRKVKTNYGIFEWEVTYFKDQKNIFVGKLHEK